MHLGLTCVICHEINDNSDDKLYNKQICTVCEVKDNGSYNYACFSTFNLKDEMVENIFVFGRYNGGHNKVFKYCWNQQIKLSAITTVKDISFDSVYEQVWKPTISQCHWLLSQLKNKTMTLEGVEKLYQIDNFCSQLSALCNAMHQCYPKSKETLPSTHEWVPQTVAHIALYHEVANDPKGTDAANVILKVQTSLKLKGDFKIIEDLANHVRK